MHVYRQADVVVHLAAHTTVQESITDPWRSFENNVIKTHRLLDTLRPQAPRTRLIFASTGGAIIGEHDGAIDEGIAARPVSPYGASKLAVEGLLSSYSGSFGLPSAALRFSNVYGPYSWRKGSVVAAFCKMYLADGVLRINGDGRQTRDYVHVSDIAEAVALVIEREAEGVFQLGTGVSTSILDIVGIFKALDGPRGIEARHVAALTGEVRHNVTDIGKARQVLGYDPRLGVADGIRDTMNWFNRTGGQIKEHAA